MQLAAYETLEALFLTRGAGALGSHAHIEYGLRNVCMLLPPSALPTDLGHAVRCGAILNTAAGDVMPVAVDRVRIDAYRELHDNGICLGCLNPAQERHEAPRLGLYSYDAGDHYPNGPYERVRVPDRPILLHELPAEVREIFPQTFSFPAVRFADAVYFQPLEHVGCRAWASRAGDQYLASDMKTLRPVPPRADNKAENMRDDFPAAHSMDTDWFAVDRDGHVAICVAGEPGPVPVTVERERDTYAALDQLFLGSGPALLGQHYAGERSPYSVAMLLPHDLDLSRIARECLRSEPLSTGLGLVAPVAVHGMPREAYQALHDSGACRGCTVLTDERLSARPLGLYCYDANDQYQNGPYERVVVPARPIRFADLPPQTRALIDPVFLRDVSFDGAPVLQPLEHVPCRTWNRHEGDQYLGSDMKTLRPVPRLPEDFPAAHSMDTDWFAVDRDGHVAICSSGEPGPVPLGIELQQSIRPALDGLLLRSAAAYFGRHYSGEDWPYSLAMLLPDGFDLEQLGDTQALTRGAVIIVQDERLMPVVVNGIDTAVRQLHQSGTCRGCTSPTEENYSAELLNLYYFETRDYQNGPYERVVAPSMPLRFGNLIPTIQQLMHPVHFPGASFADTAVLQPLEHMPCQTWQWAEGVQYLASDLKTLRPVPRPADEK